MALPAGAATKATATHTSSATIFASEVASLQGKTMALSNGATCMVSSTTCTVVSSGTSGIAEGTPLVVAANQGGVQPHLLLQAIFFGEGAGGLAESILFIVLFW